MARTPGKTTVTKTVNKSAEKKVELKKVLIKRNVSCRYGTYNAGTSYEVEPEVYKKLEALGVL